MLKTVRLLLSISFLVLASCSGSLRQSIDYAGENAAELQSVLERYEAEGDGVKIAAAEFLIGNMRLHGSKTSAAVDSFAARMLAADTLTTRGLEKWWKELSVNDRAEYVYDARTLIARYLEEHRYGDMHTARGSLARCGKRGYGFMFCSLLYRVPK